MRINSLIKTGYFMMLTKYNLRSIIITIILIIISITDIYPQDTIVVQTLTFDDITKRRGTWKFPDNNVEFRKILMYYTLKCDPRTTRDQYPCGEWDYLTYNRIYYHTGVMDSSLLEHPLYKTGSEAPDSIFYTMDTTFRTYQHYNYSIVYDNTISEIEYQLGNGDKDFSLNPGYYRYQFIITKVDGNIAFGTKAGTNYSYLGVW